MDRFMRMIVGHSAGTRWPGSPSHGRLLLQIGSIQLPNLSRIAHAVIIRS
jgi:hypothetical protein